MTMKARPQAFLPLGFPAPRLSCPQGFPAPKASDVTSGVSNFLARR